MATSPAGSISSAPNGGSPRVPASAASSKVSRSQIRAARAAPVPGPSRPRQYAGARRSGPDPATIRRSMTKTATTGQGVPAETGRAHPADPASPDQASGETASADRLRGDPRNAAADRPQGEARDTSAERQPGQGRDADAAPLIRARGLTKRFGEFTAVDGIDFDVAPGEAFGFLGPNGAGKTSTMRMIGCTSPISDGELTVLGHGPDARRPADPGPARRRAPAGHARQRADRPREPADLRPLLRAAARGVRAGAPTSCSTSSSSATAARTSSSRCRAA